MREKRFYSPFMTILALCICSLPAMAGTYTLFTTLGPGNGYNPGGGWGVSGTDYCSNGTCFSTAQGFTVAGSGSLPVIGIDLAVGYADVISKTAFYASIWTDSNGLPGTQVTGAYWSLSTSTPYYSCCGLVSVNGIEGVTLTGGQQYFMILGALSSSTADVLNWNNLGDSGLVLYSLDSGATWNSAGTQTLGAFDIISSVPEPGSLLLLGIGLISVLGACRLMSDR